MTATDQDTAVTRLSAHDRRVRGLSNWVRDFPIGQGGINEFELEQLYGMLPHTDPAAARLLLDQLGDQLLIMGGHDQRDLVYREASERFDGLVEDAVSGDETAARNAQEATVFVQPPHPTKWTVHVEGPDDLLYYDTEASARTVADNLNAEVATWPKDEFTPTVRAVVIPPESIGGPAALSLEAIRARAEAATAGPWHIEGASDEVKYICGPLQASGGLVRMEYLAHDVEHDGDAEFIAHARQDIPWLLQQIEQLGGAASAYRDAVAAYTTERNVGPLSTSLGWVIRHGEIGKALDSKASR